VKVEADRLREEILTLISPEDQAVTRRVLSRLLQEVEKQ
jgi:MarR family transcriptional regulator for hemolysin